MSKKLADYYWRSYLEWRTEYGVGDAGMSQLVAAMKSEINSPSVSRDEAESLRKLAEIVEAEVTVIKALTQAG
jgi:hypothetical protein